MSSTFSESETEAFYDAEDAFYRSFWDEGGSLHWGVFDERTGTNFLEACINLNRIMAKKSGINRASTVLDLGCGNGAVATWLCREFGCRVTGIDLSGVRIANANEMRKRQPAEIREKLTFAKASAVDLDFSDGCFSHVWSQAVIYHIHDKVEALREVHRVLAADGKLVFDDLIKPKPMVSPEAKALVYERLKFDTDFSFKSYQSTLAEIGFKVLEAQDLSAHLKTSYERLAEIAAERVSGTGGDKYRELTVTYQRMAQMAEQREVGWALYLCEKQRIASGK